MTTLTLKRTATRHPSVMTMLPFLPLLAMLSAATPAQAAFWCHDYTLYRVSKHVTGKGMDKDRTPPEKLIQYLKENNYVQKHVFSGTFSKKFDEKEIRTFWSKKARSVDKQQLLKPGDVIVWGTGHSGYVDSDGIAHFIRQDDDPYDPKKPEPPKPGGYKGGGFRRGESLEQFVSRKHRPSKASIVVYRQRPASKYKWVLTKESPILNPDNKSMDRTSKGQPREDLNNWRRQEAKITKGGATVHEEYFKRTTPQAKWTFTFSIAGAPPKELIPGDTFKIGIAGTAGGQKMELYFSGTMGITAKGIGVDVIRAAGDKPRRSGRYAASVSVGRRSSGIVRNATVNCKITLGDSPGKELELSFHLLNYGETLRYVYTRVPVKQK